MKAPQLCGYAMGFGVKLRGAKRYDAVAALACAGSDTSDVSPESGWAVDFLTQLP